jgi:hypothetical protein
LLLSMNTRSPPHRMPSWLSPLPSKFKSRTGPWQCSQLITSKSGVPMRLVDQQVQQGVDLPRCPRSQSAQGAQASSGLYPLVGLEARSSPPFAFTHHFLPAATPLIAS